MCLAREGAREGGERVGRSVNCFGEKRAPRGGNLGKEGGKGGEGGERGKVESNRGREKYGEKRKVAILESYIVRMC